MASRENVNAYLESIDASGTYNAVIESIMGPVMEIWKDENQTPDEEQRFLILTTEVQQTVKIKMLEKNAEILMDLFTDTEIAELMVFARHPVSVKMRSLIGTIYARTMHPFIKGEIDIEKMIEDAIALPR